MKLKVKVSLLSVMFLIGILLCLPLSAIAAAESDAPPALVNASDFLKNLDINGDLRIRYEHITADTPNENEVDRMRGRFRMGMKWNNPDENWKVAAGLATGGLDGTSTNATYSNDMIFETGDIRLDYAYAEHTMDKFTFLAGQMKNPFETTWALWSDNLRPAGFTAKIDLKPAFVTAGWYQVRYVDKDIAAMEAIQAGVKLDAATVAVAFYNYDQVKKYFDFTKLGMDPNYTYQIIDFYTTGDIKTDMAKFSPYAQVFYNMGAKGKPGQSILGGNLDPEKENMGWILGVDTGIDRFKIGVAYAEIEADSVQQGMKDSDFGSALNSTDVKGFRVGLGYALTQHCALNTTAMLYKPIKRELSQDAKTYQVDLNYKF